MERELKGITASKGLHPDLRRAASVADEGHRSTIRRKARRSIEAGQAGHEFELLERTG
jgi:hypothetical protein